MLKKTIKRISFVLLAVASLSAFIYLNGSTTEVPVSKESHSISVEEGIEEDHAIITPDLALVKKALFIAKCFLYPNV